MTDTVTAFVDADGQAEPSLESPAVEQKLIGQLVEQTRAKGLQLTGEGGLLEQLTKTVLESALQGEFTGHLGYDKHDPAGKDGGNSRNGTRSRTVLTDIGPIEIDVPRDQEGSFEPAIVKKRQRRLTGVDEMVLSLSAKGLTHGENSAHLAEVYGANVSRTTISTITGKVMDGMAEWQSRPLDRVYPVVFIDAVNAAMSLDPTGAGRKRWTMRWKGAMNASTWPSTAASPQANSSHINPSYTFDKTDPVPARGVRAGTGEVVRLLVRGSGSVRYRVSTASILTPGLPSFAVMSVCS